MKITQEHLQQLRAWAESNNEHKNAPLVWLGKEFEWDISELDSLGEADYLLLAQQVDAVQDLKIILSETQLTNKNSHCLAITNVYISREKELILSKDSLGIPDRISISSIRLIISSLPLLRRTLGLSALCKKSTEELNSFFNDLKINKVLEHLRLSSCGIGDVNPAYVTSALQQHRNLTKLELIANELNKDNIKSLGKVLQQNSTLLSLNLSSNEIGPVGVKILASYLANPAVGLKILNLSSNPIGSAALLCLSTAFAQNPTLTELYLHHTNIDQESKGDDLIADMLRSNPVLRVLDLSTNPLSFSADFEQAVKSHPALNFLAIKPKNISKNLLANIFSAESSLIQCSIWLEISSVPGWIRDALILIRTINENNNNLQYIQSSQISADDISKSPEFMAEKTLLHTKLARNKNYVSNWMRAATVIAFQRANPSEIKDSIRDILPTIVAMAAPQPFERFGKFGIIEAPKEEDGTPLPELKVDKFLSSRFFKAHLETEGVAKSPLITLEAKEAPSLRANTL